MTLIDLNLVKEAYQESVGLVSVDSQVLISICDSDGDAHESWRSLSLFIAAFGATHAAQISDKGFIKEASQEHSTGFVHVQLADLEATDVSHVPQVLGQRVLLWQGPQET